MDNKKPGAYLETDIGLFQQIVMICLFYGKVSKIRANFLSVKFRVHRWLTLITTFGALWSFYLEVFLQLTSALKVFLFWWGYFHMVQVERGLWQLHICIIIISEPFLFFICLMSSALPKQLSSFRAKLRNGNWLPWFTVSVRSNVREALLDWSELFHHYYSITVAFTTEC